MATEVAQAEVISQAQTYPIVYYRQCLQQLYVPSSDEQQEVERSQHDSVYVEIGYDQREKARVEKLLRKKEVLGLQRDKNGALVSYYANQPDQDYEPPIEPVKKIVAPPAPVKIEKKEHEPSVVQQVIEPRLEPEDHVIQPQPPSVASPVYQNWAPTHNSEPVFSAYCHEAPPPAYIKGRMPPQAYIKRQQVFRAPPVLAAPPVFTPARVVPTRAPSSCGDESTRTMEQSSEKSESCVNSNYAWSEYKAMEPVVPVRDLDYSEHYKPVNHQQFKEPLVVKQASEYNDVYRLYDIESTEAQERRSARENAHVGAFSIYDDVNLRTSTARFVIDTKTVKQQPTYKTMSAVRQQTTPIEVSQYYQPELDLLQTIGSATHRSMLTSGPVGGQHATGRDSHGTQSSQLRWNKFRHRLVKIGEETQEAELDHTLLDDLATLNIPVRSISGSTIAGVDQLRAQVHKQNKVEPLPTGNLFESRQLVEKEHSMEKKRRHHRASCKKTQEHLSKLESTYMID